MTNFEKFLDENREKIYKLADANTHKNDNGQIVLSKDDEWRAQIGGKPDINKSKK